ncbi:amino acid ABC transporter substrate-binding protein (PAAT family) [Geodermatophilus tzadiensis]|uniref:Amino acid ABC transporter substrate-binding protein (PAAT family) n=1 Tax=Geodermatophilus tzadiensis TaxID=1137988 RepID=A0A2T0TF96_9ACTN|nr:ABC transporter substrate-binding protein [Geodermatophilus tzadiensis]PRY44347.1 amino acid ABC transporter substrate-binding protein (PAAT family) [Geodermatophilus tzadiensis]
MTRSPRALAGAAVLVAVLATAGCDGADHAAEATGPAVALDEALHAALPEDVREAGVLTVANDPSYPPASSFGPDGRTIVGFEPDLGAALGDLLGVEVRFEASPFDTLLDDLAADRFDLVMSAVTDTAEREQQADFVNYFRAGSSIVVGRGNPLGIHDLAGLCGRSVAVEAGTVQVGLLERAQAGCALRIAVQEVPTNDDALLELRTGRADAVVADYPPAVYVTTDPRTQNSYQLVSDTQYEPGLYGIAVAPDRTELRDVLTTALQRLVEDGVYQELLDRWEVGHGAVDAVTVNGALPTG